MRRKLRNMLAAATMLVILACAPADTGDAERDRQSNPTPPVQTQQNITSTNPANRMTADAESSTEKAKVDLQPTISPTTAANLAPPVVVATEPIVVFAKEPVASPDQKGLPSTRATGSQQAAAAEVEESEPPTPGDGARVITLDEQLAALKLFSEAYGCPPGNYHSVRGTQCGKDSRRIAWDGDEKWRANEATFGIGLEYKGPPETPVLNEVLKSFPTLKRLTIDNLPEQFPQEAANLKDLVGLTLIGTSEGYLFPQEIANLANLESLVLKGNIVGEIPASVLDLPNLGKCGLTRHTGIYARPHL